jgi:excisionase family DNA binding protein
VTFRGLAATLSDPFLASQADSSDIRALVFGPEVLPW